MVGIWLAVFGAVTSANSGSRPVTAKRRMSAPIGVGGDRHVERGGGVVDRAADQRLHGGAAAAGIDQLDVEPVVLEQAAGARDLVGHAAKELAAIGELDALPCAAASPGRAAGMTLAISAAPLNRERRDTSVRARGRWSRRNSSWSLAARMIGEMRDRGAMRLCYAAHCGDSSSRRNYSAGFRSIEIVFQSQRNSWNILPSLRADLATIRLQLRRRTSARNAAAMAKPNNSISQQHRHGVGGAGDDVAGELRRERADRHLDEAGHARGGAGDLRPDARPRPRSRWAAGARCRSR